MLPRFFFYECGLFFILDLTELDSQWNVILLLLLFLYLLVFLVKNFVVSLLLHIFARLSIPNIEK